MAVPNLSPQELTKLHDMGQISDEVYNTLMEPHLSAPEVQPSVATAPLPTPTQAVAPAPTPIASAPVAPAPAQTPNPVPTPPVPVVNIPDQNQQNGEPVMAKGRLTTDQEQQEEYVNPRQQGISDAAEGVNRAIALQQQAVIEEANAGAKAANIEAGYMRQAAAENEKNMVDTAQKEARRQQLTDDYFQKYESAINDFSTAKVDPKHYWADKSTGERITAAIAIALGAAGRALNPKLGQNSALEFINKQIDRDIDMQKDQIAQKGTTANMRSNLLSQMRAKFEDTRQAENATRQVMLQNVELKMKSAIAGTKGEEAKARGAAALGKLEEEKQRVILENQKIMKDKVNATMVDEATQKGQLDNILFENPEMRKTYVPGVKGFAVSEAIARDLTEGQTAYENIRGMLQELKSLREQVGVEGYDSAAAIRAREIQKDFLSEYKNAKKFGALDKGVQEFGKGLLPEDPLKAESAIGRYLFGFGTNAANSFYGRDPLIVQIDQLQKAFQRSNEKALKNSIIHWLPNAKPSEGFQPGRAN